MNNKKGLNKAGTGILYVLAVLLAAATFLPLIITLLSSFKTNEDLLLGMFSLPKTWKFSNYPDAIRTADAIRSIGNSLFVAIATLVLTVVVALPAAYVLARKPYTYLKGIYFLFMAGVMVPVHTTLVSISKISSTLGARNSYAFLIIIYVAFNLSQAIFLFTGYIRGLSRELDEAAKIDGAGEFYIYGKIVLPLSLPIQATIGLMTGIGYWNDWTNGLYYITDSNKYSLQQLLNTIMTNIQALSQMTTVSVTEKMPSASIRMAMAVIGVLPILVLYPFFQKYFIKGIALGGVKE